MDSSESRKNSSVHLDDLSCEWCSPSSSSADSYDTAGYIHSSTIFEDRPWFHGQISVAEANEILTNAGPGTFLLREHNSSRLFLSSIDNDSKIRHFPITVLSRRYFFDGLSYEYLSDIVNFFSSTFSLNAILGKPSITHHSLSQEKYLCLEGSSKDSSNNGLEALQGDIICKIGDINENLVWATNERTGEIGCMNIENIERVINDNNDYALSLFFHSKTTEEDLNKLRLGGGGSFLIRRSSVGANYFTLMANIGDRQVQKFLIRREENEDGGYILCGRRFKTLGHIVERYSSHVIWGNQKLCRAIFYTSDDHFCGPSTSSSTADASNSNLKEGTNGTAKVIQQAKVFRKFKEDKQWKECIISLTSDNLDNGIYSMSIVDVLRPSSRCSLKLSRSLIYPLDESVCRSECCVFITEDCSPPQNVFIKFPSHPVMIDWMNLMTKSHLRSSSIPSKTVCFMRLYINKYRSDDLTQDASYSVICSLDGVKICSTSSVPVIYNKNGYSVVFDSSFMLPFLPSTHSSLQFSLVLTTPTSSKKGRAIALSSLIDLTGHVSECQNNDNGFSYTLDLCQIPVLDDNSYEVFTDWLQSTSVPDLLVITDSWNYSERAFFCSVLVSHFLYNPTVIFLFIRKLAEHYFPNSTPEALMRQDSLLSCLLTSLLRIVGKNELEVFFQDNGVLTTQCPQDVDNVAKCLTCLIESNSFFLNVLAYLCHISEEFFPDEDSIIRKVVCAVFILRFSNPILLGLLKDYPFGHHLVKAVQAAANVAAQKPEDDIYSAGLPFRTLFDKISSTSYLEPEPLIPFNGCRYLALACHLIHTNVTSKQDPPQFPDSFLNLLRSHSS